jgi:hypothetical protein
MAGFAGMLYVSEVMADNDGVLLDADGDESDWIELYNDSSNAVSLAGWYLTDSETNLTQWAFPATTLPANGFLLVFASDKNRAVAGEELHANFKLSADGEYIALVRPDGMTVENGFSFPSQLENSSWGYAFSCGTTTGLLAFPTPGALNTEVAYLGVCDVPLIGPERGFYDAPFEVSITNLTDGATVRYTTDGSTPSETNGTVYFGPVTVSGTTLLRAAAFKTGYQSSSPNTQTYLFVADVLRQDGSGLQPYGEWGHDGPDWEVDPSMTNSVITDYDGNDFTLSEALLDIPSVSLVTDWEYWWSDEDGPMLPDGLIPWLGIYADPVGENAVRRPVSMEFFTADGSEAFAAEGRVSIVGGGIGGTSAGRWKTDKLSMRVAFTDKLNYPVYGENAAQKFNGLVLDAHLAWTWAHSGSASQRSAPKYMAEAMTSDLLNDMTDENGAPHSRFVHLYLNGLYWGLYEMHERPDEHFAAEYFGGENEDYDSIKHWADDDDDDDDDHDGDPYNDNITNGDDDDYNAMLALSRADLSQADNYAALADRLDIDGFIDYILMNFFVGNTDWAHKNWYATCNQVATNGLWRYHAWDTEHIMEVNLWTPDVADALYKDVTDKDNEGGPTEVHQNLTSNAEYRIEFADHVHEHLFNGGVLTTSGFADAFWKRLREIQWAMLGEAARWADNSEEHDYEDWRTHIQDLLTIYLPYRREVVLDQLRSCGLYPNIDAPVFAVNGSAMHGGTVAESDAVTVESSGTVYYTLDGTDPRAYGGNVVGMLYTGPLAFSQPVLIRARAKSGDEWSALSEAVFRPENSPLAVTELMYHASGGNALDYIEIGNLSGETIGLSGYALDGAIEYDFETGAVSYLAPGAFLVVSKNIDQFSTAYSTNGILMAGEYSGDFDNSGETVDLEFHNEDLVTFRYSDARNWPQAADGGGHSLVPLDSAVDDEAGGSLNYGGNWRASTYLGGSPGGADPAPPATVLLNEITAHTDTGVDPPFESNDQIELYNPTALDLALDGWFLSDDLDELQKWAFPDGTLVPANGFLLLDEDDFHADRMDGFGLDKAGEAVVLSAPERIADAIRFKGQLNGWSLGRYPDGAATWLMTDPTPEAPNRLSETRLWISELMYNPPAPVGCDDGDSVEYIRIENQSDIEIGFSSDAGSIRIDGGISYTFSPDFSLEAGASLWLVSFDPADSTLLNLFCTTYGLNAADERILGPYQGQLSNTGERVAIEWPQASDDPDHPLDISWAVLDEMYYFNQSPWPATADGTGYPLVRTGASSWGVMTESDTDADALDDAWELAWFSSLDQGANEDPDHDQFSNLQEQIAGTNPTNGLSRFAVEGIQVPVLSWTAVPGRSYSVYWTDDVSRPFIPIAWGLEYPQSSYTDVLHGTHENNFYYISVEMQ